MYHLIKWLMNNKELGFKHYADWNNQIFNNRKDEGIRYPAVFFHMPDIPINYFQQRVMNGQIDFQLYIATEKAAVIRDGDETGERGLDHDIFVEQVINSIDGKWDDELKEQRPDIDNVDRYAVGTIEITHSRVLERIKSLNVTQLEVRVRYLDMTQYDMNSVEAFVNDIPVTISIQRDEKPELDKINWEREFHYYSGEFNYSGTTNIRLTNDERDYVIIDENGTFTKLSGDTNYYTDDTEGNIKFYTIDGKLSQIIQTSGKLIGDISYFNSFLKRVYIDGTSVISGDLSGMTMNPYLFRIEGENILTGDIKYLPTLAENIIIGGDNTLYGDIENLIEGSRGINIKGNNTIRGDLRNTKLNVDFIIWGENEIFGDISDLRDRVQRFDIRGNNRIMNYSGDLALRIDMTDFIVLPDVNFGLSETEVDNLLIDMSVLFTDFAPGTINISGNNAPRTSNSDTAVTILESLGYTVITN